MANLEHEHPRGAFIIPTSVTSTGEGPIVHASMYASDKEAGEAAAKALAEATGADVFLQSDSRPTDPTQPENRSNGGRIVGFNKWGVSWEPSADAARRLRQAAKTEKALQQRQAPPSSPQNN